MASSWQTPDRQFSDNLQWPQRPAESPPHPIQSTCWQKNRQKSGGNLFFRGAPYSPLSNPIYIAEIRPWLSGRSWVNGFSHYKGGVQIRTAKTECVSKIEP
jgi:hypothetical protein